MRSTHKRQTCPNCSRSAQQLEGMPERWECAHVDCPNRKPVTASAGDHAEPMNQFGGWRVAPVIAED